MSQAYKKAGVDIDAGARFIEMLKKRISRAWEGINDQIGGFAGMVDLPEPIQKFGTGADGAGTVAILCALLERFDVVGENAAAMSLVDVYVAGAHPIALLDFIKTGHLIPEKHIGIIDGIIHACKSLRKRCIIVGGETAELPDTYKYPWMVDVDTTVIGVPDATIVSGNVQPGFIVWGWPSKGPASNGFSLIRDTLGLKQPAKARRKLERVYAELGGTLADALLIPTPTWVGPIEIQRERMVKFAVHAHITGGGMVDNIPRVLPPNCKVVIDRSRIERPPVFELIEQVGKVSEEDMDRTFNQGIMVASIVDPAGHEPDTPNMIPIGQVEKCKPGESQVQFVGTFA